MSEKILPVESIDNRGLEVNMEAVDYYRNGEYVVVKRHVESTSRHDLLPVYSWFARSKYIFDEATWIAGRYDRAEVRMAELFLEDSVASLDTLTFDCSDIDAQAALAPTRFTIQGANGHIRENSEGAVLDVTLALSSPDFQFDSEMAVFERALEGSDIAYRYKKKSMAPELYLGTFKAPGGFHDYNVDEFLGALTNEAPMTIQTEPFVVQSVDLAA